MTRLVTLFGGGGFLGRYVAQELMRTGVRVRIAQRHPERAFFLRPLGTLGQTQFVAVDIARPESVRRAVAGSDAVVNLVGILSGDFDRVHVAGARAVAAAARDAGASALVHLSAIGADPQSASAYGRSKGEGERAVREVFPAATILRPSIVFGPEDQFVNRFAQMARIAPALPVIRPAVKFQPVYVADVARAVAAAVLDPERFGGQTFELGGPQTLSMAELVGWVARETGHDRPLLAIPDAVAGAMARFGSWLPGAPITGDQWLMLQNDNVAGAGVPGFEAFGVTPTPLSAVAPGWLVRYRRHGRFGKISRVA